MYDVAKTVNDDRHALATCLAPKARSQQAPANCSCKRRDYYGTPTRNGIGSRDQPLLFLIHEYVIHASIMHAYIR